MPVPIAVPHALSAGVIIAAGVLSAFDVGQRALKVLDRPAAAAAAAAPEEEAAAARDEE